MLIRPETPLFTRLREVAARGAQHLIDAGLLDPSLEGPKVEEIENRMEPYLRSGQQGPLAEESLGAVIGWARESGTAYQALGSLDIATLWYRVGQYGWRGKAHWRDGDLSGAFWADRESPAYWQAEAGVCAALAGNVPRAEELLRWAAKNRAKTDEELQALERDHDYQSIWQSLGFELFARMWLGDQWERIHQLSELGRRVIEKTRRAGHPKDFREPQLLIEIAWHLSSYFVSRTDEGRKPATDALRLDTIPDRDTTTRFNMLTYLFALARRYPEMNPYPEEVFHTRLWRPSAGKRDVPPTEVELQSALDRMLRDAEHRKKHQLRVSSVDLHIRVGGYPSVSHRLDLACEVMRRNQKSCDMIVGQSFASREGWLEVAYRTPRSE